MENPNLNIFISSNVDDLKIRNTSLCIIQNNYFNLLKNIKSRIQKIIKVKNFYYR